MKYQQLFLFFILTILLFTTSAVLTQTYAAGSNPYCLGATGKFNAQYWPGGTIDVACAGDGGTAGCTGHVTTLTPGQSYDFNNCTCAPYGTEGDGGTKGLKGGCIWVGRDLYLSKQNNGNVLVKGDTSLPAGCRLVETNPIACGSNGTVINASFTIACAAPPPTPTPTRVPPTPTPTKIPPTPTPTAAPPVLTFTASPTSLPYNGSSTLTWNTSNATSCTGANAWSGTKAVSGSQSTGSLTSSKTYTLTCSGPGGSVTKSVTVTVGAAPTATPTPTPTKIPTPTATPVPKATTFSLNVFLHGIGNSGDNANPTAHSLSNKNPIRKSRAVQVEIYNNSDTLILSRSGTLAYDSTSGSYKGTVDMGTTLSSGSYIVRVKSPYYLKRRISGIVMINAGTQQTLPTITLVTGDINNDNSLSILDYNILIGCYSDFAPAISCTAAQKTAADVTDDGKVEQFDYNLFLRDLSVQTGD